jgi:transcriptional regulator with XRE-family HTH domain
MVRKPLSAGFGQRVLQARLLLAVKRGRTVSQVEIGEALDTTGVTVGRWEAGGEPGSLELIERLAECLEVSPAWLCFGLGEMGFENHNNSVRPLPRGKDVTTGKRQVR